MYWYLNASFSVYDIKLWRSKIIALSLSSVPAAIRRGQVCPYFQHGDDRIYESEPLELIEEVNSPWQNIKIYKTQEYGNMLCLDDEISETLRPNTQICFTL